MSGEQDHGDTSIDALLDELAALRDLDRLRQAFPPGSEAHAIAARQIERRSRTLMERFRLLRPVTPTAPPSERAPARPRTNRGLRPRSPLARVPVAARRGGAFP